MQRVESVTEGHPDKLCDQVSDAILDAHLAQDPLARVACETVAAGNAVWVHGEVTSRANVDHEALVRGVVRDIGYTDRAFGLDADTCSVTVGLRQQSREIGEAVDGHGDLGAGDQGVMFGYATDETPTLMPLPIDLAHRLARRLAQVRKDGTIAYLRPDGKTQVTVGYDSDLRPGAVTAVVVSAQHDPGVPLMRIRDDLEREVVRAVVPAELMGRGTALHLNPSGSFETGGPTGDTGLTGRKIIVDSYGGAARHGGGCFSGKDATKMDRSGAYGARQAARWVVREGLAHRAEVSVAYAIGVATPVMVTVDTFGSAAGGRSDAQIATLVYKRFDLRPAAIIERLGLRRPIFRQTAAYGHFGRPDLDLPWEH